MQRGGTNAVGFSPGTFVLESQGILNSSYEFLSKLGQGKVIAIYIKGTYGLVYKAMHKKTKEIRAIKMIMKENTSKAEEERLISEINVLKGLVQFSS